MKNLTLLLLLSIICISSSCRDDNEDNPYGLPNATQSGEHTFGCLINGEPWVAEVSVIAPGLHELTMSYDETNTGVFYNNNWSIGARLANDSISFLLPKY